MRQIRSWMIAVIIAVVIGAGGSAPGMAQEVPSDPLTFWRYVNYQRQQLLEYVATDSLFVIFAKEATSEKMTAFMEKYGLELEVASLYADNPIVHRRLFVEDADDFFGRGMVFTVESPAKTPQEMLARVTTLGSLGDESIVQFASPVLDMRNQRFALSPYAVVTWSDLLMASDLRLVDVLQHHGLTLARTPSEQESAALAQLLPNNMNILAATAKVQEDQYFNADNDKTYPVLVRLSPPLTMEWKVMPASVLETNVAPRALAGAPLELRMWMTLAPGVSLPASQFSATGTFMKSFVVGVLAQNDEDEIVVDPLARSIVTEEDDQSTVFSTVTVRTNGTTVDVPLVEVRPVRISATPNDDGSTAMTVVVPFRVRRPDEFRMDKLVFDVQAVNPLTGEEPRFSYEQYYDEPITIVPLLDPDAADGGNVSPLVSIEAIPATIVGDRWPQALLWFAGVTAFLLGVMIVDGALTRMLVVPHDRGNHYARAREELYAMVRTIRRAEDFPTLSAIVVEQLLPLMGREFLNDEDALRVGSMRWKHALHQAGLPHELEQNVRRLMQDMIAVASGSDIAMTIDDKTFVVDVVCAVAEEIEKRWSEQ